MKAGFLLIRLSCLINFNQYLISELSSWKSVYNQWCLRFDSGSPIVFNGVHNGRSYPFFALFFAAFNLRFIAPFEWYEFKWFLSAFGDSRTPWHLLQMYIFIWSGIDIYNNGSGLNYRAWVADINRSLCLIVGLNFHKGSFSQSAGNPMAVISMFGYFFKSSLSRKMNWCFLSTDCSIYNIIDKI